MKKDSGEAKKLKKIIKFFLKLSDDHVREGSIIKVYFMSFVKIDNKIRILPSCTILHRLFSYLFFFSFLAVFAPVSDLSAQNLSVNHEHGCAIKASGKAYCWGMNGYGQLGNNVSEDPYEDGGTLPAAVYNTSNPSENGLIENKKVKKISVGAHHTCAITEDDLLYCWGRHDSGQLGFVTATNIPYPNIIGGDSSGKIDGEKVEDIAAGGMHTCAITESKHLYCSGSNATGQLGRPDFYGISYVPIKVDDNTYKAVYLGWAHTCAIRSNDDLYCWGYNVSGEVGNGSASSSIGEPAFVMSDVKAVTAADVATCAIKNDGTLWCWGMDGVTRENNRSPVQVESLSAVTAVAMGETHICAIASGLLYCWGGDQNGSCGLGTPDTNQVTPALIKNSSGDDGKIGTNVVTEIAAGYTYTCAVAGGAVYCWGNNGSKQLGISGGGSTSIATSAAVTDMPESECVSDPLYTNIGEGCDTGNLGICNAGIYVCNSGTITCQQQNTPVAEICNDGLDNDCNGATDNLDPACSPCLADPKYAEIGSNCLVGMSACENAGHYYCDTTAGEVKCDVDPLPPSAEVCDDGIDNDCDGKTDNEDESCPVAVACSTAPNFTKIGQDCDNGKSGSCKREGHYYCDSDKVVCNADKAIGCESCSGDINYTNIGKACDNGKSGVCKTTGVYECIVETDAVICNAPQNDGCVNPTPTLTPTAKPEETPTESDFSPYDPNIENPPSVEDVKEPLPVYVKIEGKKAKVYFQWFRDFLDLINNLKAWALSKSKKPNDKPKKNDSVGVAVEEQHCQLFPSKNAFNAAQRNCERLKKTGVRINQVTKCKKVKKCENQGFQTPLGANKGGYALKKVRRRIITGTKIQKLKKKGKEPNVITVKLKKKSTYTYRYQVVKTNSKGKIKKKLTSYSKPFSFSTK